MESQPSRLLPDESAADYKKRMKQAWNAKRLQSPSILLPPRIVTIYSDGEGATDLEVPRQVKFSSKAPVIQSSLASISCKAMGVSELLERLNEVLRMKYTLETPFLSDILQTYIDRDYDFGTTLGYLRPHWSVGFSALKEELEKLEAEDTEMRQSAMDTRKNQIVNPGLRPRRVWDLYSNRILPIWAIRKDPWAVSHPWMELELRHNVDTPINGYKWPVPIPIDTTLERVRVELLNLGAEYIWVDVLCLRQEGSMENERLRLEEWKLDVPTIGYVYRQNQRIVYYYSGLGRPFRIGDLTGKRHWLNRAWTLQEICENSVIGGIAADSPMPSVYLEGEGNVASEAGRFYDILGSLPSVLLEVGNVFTVLEAMRHRSAVSELDKIAGLGYLLRPSVLPTYIPSQPAEDAWNHLIETMSDRSRGDLLFLYPSPGNGYHIWAPSWQQVMDATKLPHDGAEGRFASLTSICSATTGAYEYHYRGHRIERCMLRGLDKPDHQRKHRDGIVSITSAGVTYELTIWAAHQQPIEEGSYVLIGSLCYGFWVVGRIRDTGHIEKVSVIIILPSDQRDLLQNMKLAPIMDNEFV